MKPTKITNNRHPEPVSESTALLKKVGRSERSPSFSGWNKSGMTDTSSSILGFTLVELIVVITILVILGTIAFTSLSGYSGSARDGSRVSDLANLSKGLDIVYIKTSSYPTPDNSFSVTYSGWVLWYQGTIGDTVMNIIGTNGAKINKKPTDPLNIAKEYSYSKLAYGNAYQLKTDWEGDTLVYKNIPESFGIPQAQAASGNPTLTYIKGTYNGVVAKTETGTTKYVLAIPSLFLSPTTGTVTLLTTTATGFSLHGQTNSGGISFTPKLVYSSGSLPSTNDERILFASGIALAYSGTVLASQSNIQPFIIALQNINTGTLASLWGGITAMIGGSAGGTPPPPPAAFTCGTSTVSDIDGNSYNTVSQVGWAQCWMATNLRTIKNPDGSAITKWPSAQWAAGWTTDSKYYSCPPNSTNTAEDCTSATTYGMFYQWSATMNTGTTNITDGGQGICPNGWHIPTDAEYKTLEEYLGICSGVWVACSNTTGWRGTNEGSKLAWGTSWTVAAGGINGTGFGTSGFNVQPSGERNTVGSYAYRADFAHLWSSTALDASSAWRRTFYYSMPSVYRSTTTKASVYPVRCLKN